VRWRDYISHRPAAPKALTSTGSAEGVELGHFATQCVLENR
jgi:hypothetical protein